MNAQKWKGATFFEGNLIRCVAKEALILLLYMAITAMVVNVFMQTRSLEEGSREFGIELMLNGVANRPYVYRQLVPIVVNKLVSILPVEEHEAFVHYHLDKYHLKQLYFGKARYANQGSEQWNYTYSLKFHAVFLIIFSCLLATFYCCRWLIFYALPDNSFLQVVSPLLFGILLPLSFLHGNFYYDFVELFFLSALLLTAIRGIYWYWLILLPLAVLNKESNILVPVLYAIVLIEKCVKRRDQVFIFLATIIAGCVFFYLKQKYALNPGGSMIWQLPKNVSFLLNPKNYFLWHDFYLPLIPFPRGLNLFWLALLSYLIFYDWYNKPRLLKLLFLSALIVNLPLWLAFCQQDEMRNLSFVFLPLYLLTIHSLEKIMSR